MKTTNKGKRNKTPLQRSENRSFALVKTSRARLIVALQQSELKFHRFLEKSRDAIVLTDEKGAIIEWNPAAEKVFYLKKEAVVGKLIWDVIFSLVFEGHKTPEHYQELQNVLSVLYETGEGTWLNQPNETEIQPAEAPPQAIQTVAFSIPTEKGFMLASVAQNITERKKANLALHRQMEELTVLNAVAKAGEEATSVEALIEMAAQAISQRLYPTADFGVGLLDEAGKVFHSYHFVQNRREEFKFPVGVGIISQVMATGQPALIPDVLVEKEYIPISPSMRSELCVPLKTRDRMIGVMNVESAQVNDFNEADEQLLMTFAGQLAVAIEKTRLYQKAVNLAERSTIINRAAQEISASLDLEQVFAAIHRASGQLMPADDFIIALLDKDKQEIETVYLIEGGIRLNSIRFPAENGLSGHVIATGRSLKFDDYENEDVKLNSVSYGVNVTRSYLFVPLKVKAKTIGVLSVQCYSPYVYSNDDQEILEMLASQAAIAIDNARLFTELQQLATIDPLTGVYNRRHFFNLAQKEVERARRYAHPLSAIMLDIDNFKAVNDTYGHAIGDQVLQAVAMGCHSQLRDTDIFCRYGGEEFTILLPDTDLSRALLVGERLRQEVEHFHLDTQSEPLGITISLGLAAFSDKFTDIDDLLQVADQALYRAKSAGRNKLLVYHEV